MLISVTSCLGQSEIDSNKQYQSPRRSTMGRRPTQSFPFTQGPRQERSQDRSLASLSSFSFPRPSSSSRTPVSPSSSPRSFSDSPVLHYTELVDPRSAPSPPVVPTRRSGLPIIPRRGNSITGSASYPSIPTYNPVISEPSAPSTLSTPSLNRMQPDTIDISSPRSSMLYSPRTEEKLSIANSRKSIHVGEKGGNVNWARPLGRSRTTKSPQLSEPEIDASSESLSIFVRVQADGHSAHSGPIDAKVASTESTG